MSTHCNVAFVENNEVIFSYYVHADGYIEGGHGEFIYDNIKDVIIGKTKNASDMKNFTLSFIKECSQETSIEFKDYYDVDIVRGSDGKLTDECIHSFYDDNDYAYVIYNIDSSPKLCIAICDYDEKIEFNDFVYKMDDFYHFSVSHQHNTIEKRVYLLKGGKRDPHLHPVEKIVANILEKDKTSIKIYTEERLDDPKNRFLYSLYIDKDNLSLEYESETMRSKRLYEVYPNMILIDSSDRNSFTRQEIDARLDNIRKKLTDIVLEVKKEFEEHSDIYSKF